MWRFNKRFYLDGQAQAFRLEIDPYHGHVEDYNASLIWMASRHVGLGVGYDDFLLQCDLNADRFKGRVRWRNGGTRIFVTVSF